MTTTTTAHLDELESLAPTCRGSHLLATWDLAPEAIRAILVTAEVLQSLHAHRVAPRCFDGGLAVSIFRDKSTRTRFSFASAASLLGLDLQELDEATSQIAHGETLRETANMISFVTEVIGIRDDIFLGQGHRDMEAVAAAVAEGHEAGVLARCPTLINLQSDLDHPTQSLADLLHLKQTFGSLEALRGRKLAMTWAYSPSYGKPLSVPQGIIGLMTRFGMHVTLAYPEGYGLVPEIEQRAAVLAADSGGSFTRTDSLDEAFENADIVYPKSWAPYSVMQRRTELLTAGNRSALDDLERECLQTNAQYQQWECNERTMKRTKDGAALYMHCLPADITGVSCAQGEVAADVFERYRLQTYREAGYKPFVIAAAILLSRVAEPVSMLRQLAGGRA